MPSSMAVRYAQRVSSSSKNTAVQKVTKLGRNRENTVPNPSRRSIPAQ